MKTFLVSLLLLFSANVNAALMDPISVNGTEWLQPIDFTGLSWAEIAAVCDPTTGACNGTLNGNIMNDWLWASVSDVNALFNHYIGSPELGPGPDAFLYNTTPNSVEIGQAFYADGWIHTIGTGSSTSLNITAGFMTRGPDVHGGMALWESFGTTARTDALWSGPIGGWFKRSDAQVPLPSTALLLGLGFLGLFRVRRKAL